MEERDDHDPEGRHDGEGDEDLDERETVRAGRARPHWIARSLIESIAPITERITAAINPDTRRVTAGSAHGEGPAHEGLFLPLQDERGPQQHLLQAPALLAGP